jgi:hypothetical protein
MELIKLSCTGDNYEEAIAKAILECKNMLPDGAQVYRKEEPLCVEYQDWVLDETLATPSPGRQAMIVDATFILHGSDL